MKKIDIRGNIILISLKGILLKRKKSVNEKRSWEYFCDPGRGGNLISELQCASDVDLGWGNIVSLLDSN